MWKDKQPRIGSEVKEFVNDFIIQFNDGIKQQGFRTCSEKAAEIKFELNITQIKSQDGGLKIHIFNAGLGIGGKKENLNSQKITVFAKRIYEHEEAVKKARIAKAKADETEQKVRLDDMEENRPYAIQRQAEKVK